VLEGGQPLSEVMEWSLDDIYRCCEILNMKGDYKTAYDSFQEYKIEGLK
jgi:hypothetical protein